MFFLTATKADATNVDAEKVDFIANVAGFDQLYIWYLGEMTQSKYNAS